MNRSEAIEAEVARACPTWREQAHRFVIATHDIEHADGQPNVISFEVIHAAEYPGAVPKSIIALGRPRDETTKIRPELGARLWALWNGQT